MTSPTAPRQAATTAALPTAATARAPKHRDFNIHSPSGMPSDVSFA